MKKAFFLCNCLFFLSCSQQQRVQPLFDKENNSIDYLTKVYFSNRYHFSELEGLDDLYDCSYFYQKNKDEILRTLEIVDKKELYNNAAVFVRYSIGTEFYREVVWFRKVGKVWKPRLNQFVSQYNDKYNLAGENTESAQQLIGRAEEWEKDGKDRYW